MKICSKCKIKKSLDNYYKNKNSYDGYLSYCKTCKYTYNKKYLNNHKEQINKKQKIYYNKNREKILKQKQIYQKENKEKINKTKLLYENKKYYTDTNYKLIYILRRRLKGALNGKNKSNSTKKLLGCSVNKLKQHLQQTAIKNGYNDFNIENYSGLDYHIDHIKPCCSFDLTKENEQLKCFNYKNLQILKAKENLIKGGKIVKR